MSRIIGSLHGYSTGLACSCVRSVVTMLFLAFRLSDGRVRPLRSVRAQHEQTRERSQRLCLLTSALNSSDERLCRAMPSARCDRATPPCIALTNTHQTELSATMTIVKPKRRKCTSVVVETTVVFRLCQSRCKCNRGAFGMRACVCFRKMTCTMFI